MDCKKAEKLLVEYLYQELSPEKTVEVEKHLEVCDGCAKTLDNWRGIHRGFQRTNDIPQPAPFLKTRILAAAREEIGRKPGVAERMFVWLKPALILPVMIFLVLVFLYLPEKKLDMAKAVPAQTETPASPVLSPAAKRKEAAPAVMEKEAEEKLKALGYLSDSKADQPAPTLRDESGSKIEGERAKTREQDFNGSVVSGMKKSSTSADYSEYQETVPKEEAPNDAMAQRSIEPGSVEPEAQQSGSVAQKAPAPPAAAPESFKVASEIGASGNESRANFDKSQSDFKNDKLVDGANAAKEAIRTDKDRALAPDFHASAREYQKKGEPQQAIVQLLLVLNNYPDYPKKSEALLELAENYERIGEYDKAIRAYQQLQRVASMNKVATEKLRTLSKKQQNQEQLRSLGYTSDKQ